jgi:hypothetical protein
VIDAKSTKVEAEIAGAAPHGTGTSRRRLEVEQARDRFRTTGSIIRKPPSRTMVPLPTR